MYVFPGGFSGSSNQNGHLNNCNILDKADYGGNFERELRRPSIFNGET